MRQNAGCLRILATCLSTAPPLRNSFVAPFGLTTIVAAMKHCIPVIIAFLFAHALPVSAEPSGLFALDLPEVAVSERVSFVKRLEANQRETYATLDGPGCIKHIYLCFSKPIVPTAVQMMNRKIIIRIFFDDSPIPHVEAPAGDFFGVMHGQNHYAIDTPLLSAKQWSALNSYFEMPFARKARIEFETGGEGMAVYLQVDWHRYPDQELKEQRRFCASWRREMPTASYGEDFFMLDADGPGQLIGFVYGVRLIDNTDRWSHGGADNIFIDGLGDHPAFIRGIGGEDVFGTSFGGALHPPETHLWSGMPYYTHEDTGEARVAQRLVGYRFFVPDPIKWRESIHMRFGTMENDVCATVYWYQTKPRRPFVKLPKFEEFLPGVELKRGVTDLPLPDHGSWWLNGTLVNEKNAAIDTALRSPLDAVFKLGGEGWVKQRSDHGFTDFNHAFRPHKRGAGAHFTGVAAQAGCVLDADRDMTAQFQITWDDHLVLRVNQDKPLDLGAHTHFRTAKIEVPLKKGTNRILLTLNNESGTNHGGWTFAFKAATPDGTVLKPKAVE